MKTSNKWYNRYVTIHNLWIDIRDSLYFQIGVPIVIFVVVIYLMYLDLPEVPQ